MKNYLKLYSELTREIEKYYDDVCEGLRSYSFRLPEQRRDDDFGGVCAVLRDGDPPRVPRKPLAFGRTFRDEHEV